MNKAIRIISIVMMAVLVIGALTIPALASTSIVDRFTPDQGSASGVINIFDSVIGIVQVVGTGIAIVMLLVLAIKYLIASPDGKGEIKKAAVPYVVAAVILFAAVNIISAIEYWAQDIDII